MNPENTASATGRSASTHRRRLATMLAIGTIAAGTAAPLFAPSAGAVDATTTVVDTLAPWTGTTVEPGVWYKRYEAGVPLGSTVVPAGNTGELVTGPAQPPAGEGSLALTTANTTVQGKATAFTYGMAGTRLADLTGISFWSYSGTTPIAAVLQMEIFRDGTTGFSTLSLEPSNGNGGPTLNSWERYQAGPGLPGKVWLTGSGVTVGAQNSPITWDTLVATYPNATIMGGVGLNLGRGPTTGTVHADKVEFSTAAGTTTYDFEPTTYVTPVPAGDQTVSFEALPALGSPSISGTFGENATVTVAPYSGPGTTPFTVTGPTVDIDVTGFTPPATVCLDSSNADDRLYHFVDGGWQDVTADGFPLDGRVCGLVDTFSPFAVGAPLPEMLTVTGFTSPVDMGGVVNVAKAGQAIPLKFRITDDSGVGVQVPGITVAVSAPSVNCTTLGQLTPDTIETYTGTSGLQYLGNGYYQWNWKTAKTFSATCRTLTLTASAEGFDFGTPLQAQFRFTR